MINKRIQLNRGYTLLFAVIVSSLVLSVGISILNISKKEFLLASGARESTTAFYAADSGLECAVYYDFNKDSFSPNGGNITCNNSNITIDKTVPGTYKFELPLSGTSCAIVTVTKTSTETDIESRGYNLGWNTLVTPNRCDAPSPRRVERAIGYHYSTAP